MRQISPSPSVIDLRDRLDAPRRPLSSDIILGADHSDSTGHTVSTRSLRNARLAALWAMVALNIIDLFVNRAFTTARASDADVRALVLFGGEAMPWMKGAVLVALGWAVLRSAPKLSSTCAMWCVVGVYALATWMNLAILIVSS